MKMKLPGIIIILQIKVQYAGKHFLLRIINFSFSISNNINEGNPIDKHYMYIFMLSFAMYSAIRLVIKLCRFVLNFILNMGNILGHSLMNQGHKTPKDLLTQMQASS